MYFSWVKVCKEAADKSEVQRISVDQNIKANRNFTRH